jgi:hypothetical protein
VATTYQNNGTNGIIGFVKSQPLGSFLAAMLLFALIVPPRKRKYKSKPKRSRRRKQKKVSSQLRTGIPNRKKVKKSKKARTRTRTMKGSVPNFMVKGSSAAKAHMAKLRAMRHK